MRAVKFSSLSAVRHALRTVVTRKRLLFAVGIIVAFLVVTPVVTYAYYAHDIANRDRLMNHNDTGVVLLDRHGKPFYEYGTVNPHDDVPLSQISDNVEHAAIASEDKGFYSNPGFSVRGTAGALWADVRHGDPTAYGGSTITQQLVKDRLLSSSKNYFRKYQEIAMAVAIDHKYSKDQILDMYLNSVYFGEGAFGISEASKVYFHETPAQLNLAQSSMLIGLLPAPSAYSPISGSATEAKQQQQRVLSRMVETGYISSQQKQQALSQKLDYAAAAPIRQKHGQHFAQMVIDQLYKKYGEERVIRSGFEVTTTLDLGWQKQAETVVKQQVSQLSPLGAHNASLVAEDPKTGQVRALVGSVDWHNKQFGQVNMATTPRQPGSSFKPIYYSKAFDKHLITPATILDDSKKTFGGNYTPRDFDFRYEGKMPVRSALAESRNVPAVEVMQKLGVKNAIQAAHEMGLSTVDDDPSHYGLSLALGTAGVRLVDMVNAYTAFANQGQMHEQTYVTSIKNKFGDTVYQSHPSKPKQVRSPGAAYLIASILSDKTARAPTYGTRMNIPGYDVAFKTGTTNDDRDGWTIGFTPSLVVGVWMGNNDHTPMQLGGSESAGTIWKPLMTKWLHKVPKQSFQKPDDVTQVLVCRGTDQRAVGVGSITYSEYFLKGTTPTSTCNTHPARQAQPKTKPPEHNKHPATQQKPKQPKLEGGRGGDAGSTNTSPPPTNCDTSGGTAPTDSGSTTTSGSGDCTTDSSGSGTNSGGTDGGTTDGGTSGGTDGGTSGSGTSSGSGDGGTSGGGTQPQPQ